MRTIINFQRNLKSSHGNLILKFHSDMNREANSRVEIPRPRFPKYQYPITSHILACIHNCTLKRIFQIIAKGKIAHKNIKRSKISISDNFTHIGVHARLFVAENLSNICKMKNIVTKNQNIKMHSERFSLFFF